MSYDPRRTPQWKRLRLECYKRDKARGAVCVHCGQPIDYSAKPSSTDSSYEPDHRLVVERHPELYYPRTYNQVIDAVTEREGRRQALTTSADAHATGLRGRGSRNLNPSPPGEFNRRAVIYPSERERGDARTHTHTRALLRDNGKKHSKIEIQFSC